MLRVLRPRGMLPLRVLQVLLLEDLEALQRLRHAPSPEMGHVRGQVEALPLHSEAACGKGNHEGGLGPGWPRA